MLTFNGTNLRDEYITASRNHFINNVKNVIDEIEKGLLKVNNKKEAISYYNGHIEALKNSNGFTVLQYAYYLQTGDMVALLP